MLDSSDDLSTSERLAIEAACLRLAADFCLTSDIRDVENYGALYTEDARFVRPGFDGRGREAIMEGIRRRPPNLIMRHAGVNAVVDVLSATEAKGRGNHLVLVHDKTTGQTGSLVAVDYEDRYSLTPEGWKIAEREVRAAF